MYEYENIEAAAHHRDWQECAGIMFGLLYRCATEGQRNVAREALRTYVVIWNTKHEDVVRQLPQLLLTPEIHGKRPKLPEFPEDLDPADAEFENGLIEYYNGAFFSANHGQHTMEFATAIQSAVVARQNNKWLSNHQDDYANWKSGSGIGGPTFLDDEAAAKEAEIAWKLIDASLKGQPKPLRQSWHAAVLYKRWEDSVL